MRIALCISGQPRTWRKSYQSWFDSISHLGEIDVFYYMPNYNTLPSMARQYTRHIADIPITQAEADDIYCALSPKKFVIDTVSYNERSPMKNPIGWWAISQFRDIKKCAHLKRQYEIENNFEYDLVFRLRTDLLLQQNIDVTDVLPNTVYTCVNSYDREYNAFRVGDIFYYADSYTYDQSACFYNGLSYIDATDVIHGNTAFPPELAFYYYMKSVGLQNKSVSINCKIMRTDEYSQLKGGLDAYELS